MDGGNLFKSCGTRGLETFFSKDQDAETGDRWNFLSKFYLFKLATFSHCVCRGAKLRWIERVRLKWILSPFPVTSRDQVNFGIFPNFSFILGLGEWSSVGGIKYTLFDSLNPNLDKKGCFYQNWIGHVMWLEWLIIFILTLPGLKSEF